MIAQFNYSCFTNMIAQFIGWFSKDFEQGTQEQV